MTQQETTHDSRRRAAAARSLAAAALAAALLALTAPAARASQVRIFQTQGAGGFLGGKLTGVSVDALGRVRLAASLARVASLSEPFAFSAVAVHGRGGDFVAVGTGSSGKVLAIDRDGAVRELFTAPEPDVFALWADPDGTVYAGTSPHGKVYRIAGDGAKGARGAKGAGGAQASVFFDPGQTYIWALARDAAGRLLVATGTQGKLFRVDASGHGEVAMTVEDTHVRSLAPLPDGDVLVGTAGRGLILRLGRGGSFHTVFQAEEPEVAALAAAPDGTVYAAAISSEASLVDLGHETAGSGAAGPGGGPAPPPTTGAPPAGGGGGKPAIRPSKPQAALTEESAETPAAGSRRAGAGGPRSEILRLDPDGRVETAWSFAAETVFSLLWQRGKLWVGTGVEGKLFAYSGGQMALEGDLDDHQIVALLPGATAISGPDVVTTNAATLYRPGDAAGRHGTYLSASLDAGQLARFGSFRWLGELPEGTSVRLAFRSGMSSVPDGTWSAWIEPPPAPAEQQPAAEVGSARSLGGEVFLRELPPGRFVQWRAEMVGEGDRSPVLYTTELSYRQENLRPRIVAFGALDPGQILVPASFNPSNQVYEPAHPNREGIFVPVGVPAGEESGRTKVLWKMGYQTLRWTAADPNEDPLVYDLYVRPAAAPDDGAWLKMATDLEEEHYSFDATVLPDGLYRFRLVASDRQANDPESALSAERISEPVVIDHTPPTLVGVHREGKQLRATVHDTLSPIREAVFSVDAGPWKPARAADGLLDGLTETVVIDDPAPKPGQLLLLRVTDAAYNVVTFDLSPRR